MAQLTSDIAFTGKLGSFSAYKMRGSDKIILRTKGGASKKMIEESPNFAKTRKINMEFGGRSVASKNIMKSIMPLKPLADYNIAGPLNALIKPIQAMDIADKFGKRDIYFSRHPKLLEGFSLNKRNPFDSIIRNPVSYKLSRENLSASVEIPALIPAINFFVPAGRYPMYSIIVVLGIVPDITFANNNRYYPTTDAHHKKIQSDWHPVTAGSKATTLEVSLDDKFSVQSFSVILSIGIAFGTVGVSGQVGQVQYAGAAKVLSVE